jgi:plastocyanin
MRTISIVPTVLVAVVVAAAALLFSSCGGTATSSSSSSAPPSASATAAAGNAKIDISNFMYSPGVLTVKVGSTVTVTNEDAVEHTATSDTEGAFETGTLTKGQSMRIKLNKVGTYSFHCAFHAFMHGTIKVVQ